VNGSTALEKAVEGFETSVPMALNAAEGEVQRPIPEEKVAVVAAVETVEDVVSPIPSIMISLLEDWAGSHRTSRATLYPRT
jgi:hypothetical protein